MTKFIFREIAVKEVPGGKVYAHDGGLLIPSNDGKFVSSKI